MATNQTEKGGIYLFTLDYSNKDPIYQQIVNQTKSAIAKGYLKENDQAHLRPGGVRLRASAEGADQFRGQARRCADPDEAPGRGHHHHRRQGRHGGKGSPGPDLCPDGDPQ